MQVVAVAANTGFSLFDLTHLCWLAAMLAFGAMICIFFCLSSEKAKRCTEIVIGCCIIGLEAAKYIWLIANSHNLIYYLPLHLCSLAVYIEFLDSVFPNKFTHELCYAICLPGAFSALIFPGWTYEPIGSFLHIHSFLIHFLLVLYPLLLLISKRLKPSAAWLPVCFAFTVAAAAFVYYIDKLTGMNYMFLITPPPGSPLEVFERWWGNPGFLFGYPIIAAAIWILMYVPFALFRRRN